MNFTIPKRELFRMLSKLKAIPSRSSSMAVLSHLHIMTAKDALFITATDLEVAVRAKTRVEVFDEGAVALPGDPLFRIVQKMPDGDISFESEVNHRVRISGGNARFNLAGLDGGEFPEFPNIIFKERLTIPSRTLQDMLEKTLFAVSKNEGMVSLAGVFMVMCGNNGSNTLYMVATDGHRMARETDEDLELQIDKNNIAASLTDKTLIIRLLAGRFPDYRAVTENIDGSPVISDRESFGECLERICVMANDHNNHVSLNLTAKDRMEMKSSSRSLGDAEDHIPVQTELEEITVGFNVNYLLQCLKVMKSREVNILLKDGRSPALLTGKEDEGFSYMIMPLVI